MPVIHEAIESDESFSSLSEHEPDNSPTKSANTKSPARPLGLSPSHAASTPTSVKAKRIENKDKQHLGSGHSSRSGKGLVEYSDVSSEEFSGPEAGELSESPGQSPPNIVRHYPSQSYSLQPPEGHSQLVNPVSIYPSKSPFKQRPTTPPFSVPISAESFSEIESGIVAPQVVNHHLPLAESHTSGILPHSLVPYPSNMSPDRRGSDLRPMEYYRGREDYHASRIEPDISREQLKARRKEHKEKKKRKHEKKRKKVDYGKSPGNFKRKKKKKHKSRSGSPTYHENNSDIEGSVSSSELVEVRYTSHNRIKKKGTRNRTGEHSPTIVVGDADSPSGPGHYDRNYNYSRAVATVGSLHHGRGRERSPSNKYYDRGPRLHNTSPRRMPPSQGRISSATSPRRVLWNKGRHSRSPIYVEYPSDNEMRYRGISKKENHKRRKKVKQCNVIGRAHSKSLSRSRSRSRPSSPRLVLSLFEVN